MRVKEISREEEYLAKKFVLLYRLRGSEHGNVHGVRSSTSPMYVINTIFRQYYWPKDIPPYSIKSKYGDLGQNRGRTPSRLDFHQNRPSGLLHFP